MMGQLSSGQDRLFYSFNLEDHIPKNHLLRSIDRCLDLSDLRHYLADFYSPIGRPSIDPELIIRMLVVGYCYGIRSERRLCEGAHLNLAYRWFCRLSLEDEVLNHSTFSKNRHGRFRDSDLFRWLFNEVLRRCMDAGLVKGEGFAVDASIIKADASRQRGVPGNQEVNWSDPSLSTSAVREYLEALDEEALAEALPKRLSLTGLRQFRCAGDCEDRSRRCACCEGIQHPIGHVLAKDGHLDTFIAADDTEAKALVSAFIESLGLRPLDVGGLHMAHTLEALGLMMIGLAKNGAGTWDIALNVDSG